MNFHKMLTVNELNEIIENARKEGFKEGFHRGRNTNLELDAPINDTKEEPSPCPDEIK